MQTVNKVYPTVNKLYTKALSAFENQRWQWAETLVTATLVIDPDHKESILLKANIMWCTNRNEQACELYQDYIFGRC